MATYKQPCIHCRELIERSCRICTNCQSHSPFGYQCPSCLLTIDKNHTVCGGCGRTLYVFCPSCHQQTFTDEKCGSCGADLTIRCNNSRCGELQFFENIKCTACGSKLSKK